MRARLAFAIGLLAAGCGLLPGERPELGVANGTDLVVIVTVNGELLGEFPPHGPGPEIDVSRLPPLPWTVEARTVSGRLLTSTVVKPGDVQRTAEGDVVTLSGALARVDLSCGRLDIWAGFRPSGPMPGPGKPGDCEP